MRGIKMQHSERQDVKILREHTAELGEGAVKN
jgi:hypothetical protein